MHQIAYSFLWCHKGLYTAFTHAVVLLKTCTHFNVKDCWSYPLSMAVLFLKSHLVSFLSYFSLTLLGSQGYWPSSSLSSYTEEHLVFEMLKDNTTQSAGIQIHSATPTRRGEISANEPGTSGKCMYVCACLCVICHSI